MPIASIQRYIATKKSTKYIINVSPSIDGVSSVNLADFAFTVPSYGEYTITAQKPMTIFVKMWGGAGGSIGITGGSTAVGAAGGYSEGKIELSSSKTYKIIVGEKGANPRVPYAYGLSSSGGGGTAFLVMENNVYVPAMVAGAGGGAASFDLREPPGAGGGLTGQSGWQSTPNSYGSGGTQTSSGMGNLSRNGSDGYLNDINTYFSGGRGFGNGGDGGWGTSFTASSYGSGGGGGYYGGAGGARNYPGGGGSGHINSTYIIGGVTETGNGSTPPRETDSYRENSGGFLNNLSQDGKIVILLSE